jgi:tetratricopeptide (TPR) repeat protein
MTLCREGHYDLLLPPTSAALGEALTLAGRLEEALRLLEQVVETAVAKGLKGGVSLHLARLGRGMLSARRPKDAYEVAHRALAAARTHKERGHEAWVHHLLGDIASHGDSDAATAAGRYAEAMTLARELGMHPLTAHCHGRLAELCGRAGRRDEARHHLSRATAMCREMDMSLACVPVDRGAH